MTDYIKILIWIILLDLEEKKREVPWLITDNKNEFDLKVKVEKKEFKIIRNQGTWLSDFRLWRIYDQVQMQNNKKLDTFMK